MSHRQKGWGLIDCPTPYSESNPLLMREPFSSSNLTARSRIVNIEMQILKCIIRQRTAMYQRDRASDLPPDRSGIQGSVKLALPVALVGNAIYKPRCQIVAEAQMAEGCLRLALAHGSLQQDSGRLQFIECSAAACCSRRGASQTIRKDCLLSQGSGLPSGAFKLARHKPFARNHTFNRHSPRDSQANHSSFEPINRQNS